jgi:DNA-binding NarL/FixJ family response regulator
MAPHPGSSAAGCANSKEVGTTCMTESAPISVYLVDDVPELRELIRFGIEQDPEFQVVGEAGDGRTALEGIAETQPAAVLLDLSMPDMNGLEAIFEIRKGDPDVAIIVLSGFSADRMGGPALERGADGYVEKGTPIQDLRDATRTAVARRRED